MQNRIAIPFLLFGLFIFSFAEAQVKIGDNPQVIDPTSILELESSDKVLVITRVDSLQMTTIVPNRGALVYNTTADCVFYYDGTQWINMCGATGTGPSGPLTADPIVNDISTIVITPTIDGDNFEVAPNSINSEQIVNGGVNGVDIQDGSIGQGKLQDNSVTQDKLSENSVGAFAIDNDNIDLGDFTNNAGFITGAEIVSADPGNVITDSNGAFYDDSGLQTAIAANTIANAADNDQSITNEIQALSIIGDQLTLTNGGNTVTIPTANGSDTKINPTGANVTVTGTGTIADPYTINAADQADPSITNELTDLDFDIGTNILTLTNPLTATNSVDLSSLAGGGGTDNQNLTLTGNILEIEDGNTVDFTPILGGGGNQNLSQVLTTGASAGNAQINDLLDPTLDQDAATKAYVDATAAAGGPLTDGSILIGGAGDVAQQLAVGGDATLANNGDLTIAANVIDSDNIDNDAILLEDLNQNSAGDGQIIKWNNTAGIWEIADDDTGTPSLTDGNIFVGGAGAVPQDVAMSGDATIDNTGTLTIEEGAIDSDKIGDGTIALVDFNQMGAADGQTLKWDDATTSWIVASGNSHTGTPKSIFFADENGDPANPEHPTNGNASLIWDDDARVVGGTAYGALGIGLDGNTISPIAKTHIEDIVIGDISYPLQIQNRSNTGATGIIFSVIGGSATKGKGVLAFERNGTQGIGDFHFLQDTSTDNGSADLGNKSFSILSNKDIQLYGNLIARNGAGSDGQVLTTDASGDTVWGAGGSSSITDTDANDGLNDFNGTAGYNINVDDTTIELNSDALRIKDEGVTSAKIANGTIALEDLSAMTAAADGQILKWNQTASAWEIGTDNTVGTLADASIFVGDATATPIAQNITGDASMNNLGILTIANNAITPAKIEASLNASPTGQVLTTDEFGEVVWEAPAGSVSNAIWVNPLIFSGDGSSLAEQLNILNNAIEPNLINEGVNGQVLTTTGTDVVWAAPAALEVNLSTFSGDGTSPLLELNINDSGITTEMLEDDAVTAAILNGDVVGNGLTQNGAGALEVDTSVLMGSGTISGSEIIVTGGPNATFTNVLLEIGPNAITSAKIANDAVTTAEILNGTIADIDISATAGIVGSKINPIFVADVETSGVFISNAITLNVPDYVFQKYFLGNSSLNKNYDFKSLEEIEAFVKKYNHLPGIKSAAQVKEEGSWNLSKSNLQNLEKIEELYLHTINQEKEINRLKTEKETLFKEMTTIKKDLEEIKALLKK